MAADLHIHVFEDEITERDLTVLFCHTLGTKYCNLYVNPTREEERAVEDKVWALPNIWIGEVSWLKAALFEDDKFIPGPVQAVSDVFGGGGEVIELTKENRQRIVNAMMNENTTGYSVASANSVREFLEQYGGYKAFTISW